MVPTSHDGYVIGDGILFYLDENELPVRRSRAYGELDSSFTPRLPDSRSR